MLLEIAYGRPVSAQAMRYIKRGGELMREMQDKDWHDRTPHDVEHVPVLAKVSMMLALAGLNGMEASRLPQLAKAAYSARRGMPPERLLKRYAPMLWKASVAADEDDDDEDSSDDTGAGGGNYNPDEPRVPAGQPGGGQWTTGGGGVSPDSGSMSADDIRTALREGFDNPSLLPQGMQVATNDTVQSDASPNSASTTLVTQPASNLTLSNQGVDFLTQHESFRSDVYQDNAGYDTIGYGHRLTDGESYPDGITQAQAAQLLAQDTATAQRAVQNNVTANLTQAQFDALTSFAYNVGATNFANSTLVRNINDGNNAAAAAQFNQWVHSANSEGQTVVNHGLVNRRAAERDLFENSNY